MIAYRGIRRNYHYRRCCPDCGQWEVVSPGGKVVVREPTWGEARKEFHRLRRQGVL